MTIRIGILGYGNLGKGIECAIKQNNDMELKAVFTRRDPATVKIQTAGVPVYRAEDAVKYKDEIPNQLLGNSFSDILLESPFDAMAELSRRIEVYRDVVKRISSNHPYGKRIANLDKT